MNADKFRGTVSDYMEQRHIRTKEQLSAYTTKILERSEELERIHQK